MDSRLRGNDDRSDDPIHVDGVIPAKAGIHSASTKTQVRTGADSEAGIVRKARSFR